MAPYIVVVLSSSEILCCSAFLMGAPGLSVAVKNAYADGLCRGMGQRRAQGEHFAFISDFSKVRQALGKPLPIDNVKACFTSSPCLEIDIILYNDCSS